MNRRLYARFSILSVVAILSIAFFLAGCCIFGGKSKEKKAEETVAKAPVAASEKSQAKPAKPLKAAGTSDESKFETDDTDYEIKTVNGALNWSKGFIRAKGYGVLPDGVSNPQQARLMAFRAAYADALANLLEITAGVNVTATTTVEDYMLKDHTIELKVQGVVKGSKEVERVFDEDKKMAIIEVGIAMENLAMGIPSEPVFADVPLTMDVWETKGKATLEEIAGDNMELSKAISSSDNLDDIESKIKNMAAENEELLATVKILTREITEIKGTETKPVVYTGVVVDAAGSDIKPCIAPNIYYKSGDSYKLLYGMEDGRARDNNMHALVGWERTLAGASDNERVTRKPLVIKATHLSKEQAALAINEDDAKTIEALNQEMRFLEEGRVVVIR